MMTVPFIEGVQYYLDNGKIIMTELYHKSRGYCCGKGCRHCPFDPPNTLGTMEIKESESQD